MGGAEASLVLMAKSLCGQSELAVACPVPSPLSKTLTALAVTVHGLPEPPRVSHMSPSCYGYWVKTMCRLVRLVRTLGPDLIHANNLYAGVVSVLAAVMTNTKLVIHMRDLANLGLPSRLCSWFCERVIAVSLAVRDELGKSGVRPGKIRVLYNAVDDRSIPSPAADMPNTTNGHDRHPFVFAHVGQFVPWKNHVLFLEAATRVARDLPDCRFVLVGDDVFRRNSSYKRDVFSYVERSPVCNRITLMGWQEDMDRVWPRVDCLVHTADREPFGRVIIEAMAHKVPVIAVGCCGPAEIIQDGETGILVRNGDACELSPAMLRVARDRRLTRRLTAAGYEYVRSNFTTSKMIPQLLQVYREVLAL